MNCKAHYRIIVCNNNNNNNNNNSNDKQNEGNNSPFSFCFCFSSCSITMLPNSPPRKWLFRELDVFEVLWFLIVISVLSLIVLRWESNAIYVCCCSFVWSKLNFKLSLIWRPDFIVNGLLFYPLKNEKERHSLCDGHATTRHWGRRWLPWPSATAFVISERRVSWCLLGENVTKKLKREFASLQIWTRPIREK